MISKVIFQHLFTSSTREVVIKYAYDVDHNLDKNYETEERYLEAIFRDKFLHLFFFTPLFTLVLLGIKC